MPPEVPPASKANKATPLRDLPSQFSRTVLSRASWRAYSAISAQLRGILRGTRNRTPSNLARCYISANLPALEYLGHMLTPSELVAWLGARRSVGHSFSAIGRDLGVSRQAVQQWLSGATQPSRTVLLLAEPFCRAPLDLAQGLPVAAGRDRPT